MSHQVRREVWNLTWFAILATAIVKVAGSVSKLPAVIKQKILR